MQNAECRIGVPRFSDLVGRGIFAEGESFGRSVFRTKPETVFGEGDGTFLSVATEKYPKDRDLRKNQGFPLKIPFLFHENN